MKIVINGNDSIFDELKKNYRIEITLVLFAAYMMGRKITKREKEITKLNQMIEELKSKGE